MLAAGKVDMAAGDRREARGVWARSMWRVAAGEWHEAAGARRVDVGNRPEAAGAPA
jgi:hypothetical protein